MSVTYYDLERIGEKVEEARRKTSDELRDMRKGMTDSAKMQEKLLEAFNRMTLVLESLSEDIKGLRNDLNPTLDKPKKLPAPATGG